MKPTPEPAKQDVSGQVVASVLAAEYEAIRRAIERESLPTRDELAAALMSNPDMWRPGRPWNFDQRAEAILAALRAARQDREDRP